MLQRINLVREVRNSIVLIPSILELLANLFNLVSLDSLTGSKILIKSEMLVIETATNKYVLPATTHLILLGLIVIQITKSVFRVTCIMRAAKNFAVKKNLINWLTFNQDGFILFP
jgi:hypothetical protein